MPAIVFERNVAKEQERERLRAIEDERRSKMDTTFEGALSAAVTAIEQNMRLHQFVTTYDGDGGFMFGFHKHAPAELATAWDNIEKNLSSRFTFFDDASGAAWGMFMRQLQYRLRQNMRVPA